ncbi:MAG TPA: 50S ribosomal protein L24 [Acetobacteraceae bacterium]|jgi:large subunit ribosomal protein L24|nr:50S ribosomal protein L24 [Acetobacteraceae bacterium]
MAARIRKGDQVEVISGEDKGKRGEVTQVLPKENRAVVQGVRLVTRHQKPRGVGQPGGIVEREAPLHLSKLALIDPKTDRTTRVGFRRLEDGRKVRFARKSGEAIDR